MRKDPSPFAWIWTTIWVLLLLFFGALAGVVFAISLGVGKP